MASVSWTVPFLSASERGMKRRAAGIGLIALGALVLVTPAGDALSQLSGDTSSVSSPTPVPGSAGPGAPQPALTPDQETQARQLFASDETAQRILQGRSYTVNQLGPWGGDHGEPMTGAVMVVQLAQPASFAMQTWPLIDFKPGLDPPYREQRLSMAARNVIELLVNVDLQRARVVSIDPYGDAEITPGQDYLEHAQREAATTGD